MNELEELLQLTVADALAHEETLDESDDSPPEVQVQKLMTAFQKRAKDEQARFVAATDSEYWVAVCFETREQKEEFLRRTELSPLGDKYIDGLRAAKILGVELTSPRAIARKSHVNKKLEKLT